MDANLFRRHAQPQNEKLGVHRGRGRFQAPKTYINAIKNAANFRDNGINTRFLRILTQLERNTVSL